MPFAHLVLCSYLHIFPPSDKFSKRIAEKKIVKHFLFHNSIVLLSPCLIALRIIKKIFIILFSLLHEYIVRRKSEVFHNYSLLNDLKTPR
jgi:hypothetical protein